jgi:hypothetical protein
MGIHEARFAQRRLALDDGIESAGRRDEARDEMRQAIAERYRNHLEAVDDVEAARKDKNTWATIIGATHGVVNFFVTAIDPATFALGVAKAAVWTWATREVVGKPIGEKANDNHEIGSANFLEKSKRHGVEVKRLELEAGEASRMFSEARREAGQVEQLGEDLRSMEQEAIEQLGGSIGGVSRSPGAARVRQVAARQSRADERSDRADAKALRSKSIEAQRVVVTLESKAEKERIQSQGWKAFMEGSAWIIRSIGIASSYWTAGISAAAAECIVAGNKWAVNEAFEDADDAAAGMRLEAGRQGANAILCEDRAERLEEAAEQAAGIGMAIDSGQERLLRALRGR